MESDVVIGWVIHNGSIIEAYAYRLRENAPYEERDYMQEAFIAGLKAYKIFPDTAGEPFRQAFWRIFKDALIEIIPIPKQNNGNKRIRSNESMSIPSRYCEYDETVLNEIPDYCERKTDYCEFVFWWARPSLTSQEAAVLSLSLGLGREGSLSVRSIAKEKGLKTRRVRELLGSSLGKIINQIEETNGSEFFKFIFTAMQESYQDSLQKGA